MPIPDRPRQPSADPRLNLLQTDDHSWTLEDKRSGDTFHSGCGAFAECRHVYLLNSDVAARLDQQLPTSVLEIGFGFGLAFLTTAVKAIQSGTLLRYVATEADPLHIDVMRQLAQLNGPRLGKDDASQGLCDHFLNFWMTEVCPRRPRARGWVSWDPRPQLPIVLQLWIGDRLDQAMQTESDQFDAIYFDPFSPASAAELWSDNYLRQVVALLKRPAGKLVSYCVNSHVRRQLAALTLVADRVPGPPGGKREVLVAHFS